MNLLLLARLSVRNLLRHRRRNAMLVSAIVVAVSGVAYLNTLIRAMQHDLREGVVENLTGHVKVHAPGYLDDPNIDKSFVLDQQWQPAVEEASLAGWTARVRVPAVIMSERETRGIQLVGIDPAQEQISFLGEVTVDGEQLTDPDDKRVLIGAALAEQLNTRIGRRLVIISQGSDGRSREAGYRIAGVYDAEGTGLEKAFAFTGVAALQRLLDTEGVTEVSVRLSEDEDLLMGQARESLTQQFADLVVLSWQELEPQAAAMFVFAESAIFIWFAIMMGALIFGLVNSLVTAVLERVRELGVLRALGMRAGAVVTQVVIESLLIMGAGVTLGLLLGWVFYLWTADGIDLSQWATGMESVGMSSLLVPQLYVSDFVMVAALSMFLGFVASLYPAVRAVRIKPLEAMRK